MHFLFRRRSTRSVPMFFAASCLMAFFLIGCGQSAGTEKMDSESTDKLIVSSMKSGEPNLTVSPDSSIFLSWIEKGDAADASLKFAKWTGDGWTNPTTIASGDNWFVNWADVPSLTVHSDNAMTAHWLETTGTGKYAYGVRISSSNDGGVSWSDAQWLQEDVSDSEHGFAVVEPIDENTLVAAWLDGRKYATGENEMSLISRRLTNGSDLSEEVVVDDLVCDCCPVASTASTDGGVIIAYRNRTEEEIRDINTAYFNGTEWSLPANVHPDNWKIAGCPVNGPAIDVDESGSVIAWFTAADEQPKVLAAFGSTRGEDFNEPTRIDNGNPVGRVDVMSLPEGSALILWMENETEGEASLLVRRLDGSGLAEPTLISKMSASRSGGMPKMAYDGTSVIFAWTDVSETTSVVTRSISLDSL